MARSLLEVTTANVPWQGWATLALVALGLVVIFAHLAKTELVMLAVLVLLQWMRVLSVDEAISGFAYTSVLSVMGMPPAPRHPLQCAPPHPERALNQAVPPYRAALMVMAQGVAQTGALDAFFRRALGPPRELQGALVRLSVSVACASALLITTPIATVVVPIVLAWARTSKLPASQLMIPASYASMLGGACTLIGASTNVILQGASR